MISCCLPHRTEGRVQWDGSQGQGGRLGQGRRGRFLPGGATGSPGNRAQLVQDGSIGHTEELGGTLTTCQ